jgi:long-chain fatty acid transport protein
MRSGRKVLGASLLFLFLSSMPSAATEGMFQHAYGLRHKALAGAGVAAVEDATGISINPAGLVDVGEQFNMGLSAFMPFREYEAAGTTQITPGRHESDKNFYPAPTLAWVTQLNADTAVAFSIFGNGGMNTTYPAFARALPCRGTSPGTGPFCFGKAGVDLMQMFISAAIAHRFNERLSLGVAPIFAVQRFKAYGIGNAGQGFSAMSAYQNNFSGLGYDWSVGGGVRLGATVKLSETLSLGFSWQSRICMGRLDKYKGLFAERGNLDIPANLQLGLAWQATPTLRLMLDWRYIFNDGVKAIGRSSTFTGVRFGTDSGPGFGWRDTSSLKIAAEYQWSDDLILRAGYAYIWPNPVPAGEVAINIISPGVIRHEFTGGGTWRLDAHNDLDFAFMFAPTSEQCGTVPAVYGGGRVCLRMHQFEVSLGWTYNFGKGSRRAR